MISRALLALAWPRMSRRSTLEAASGDLAEAAFGARGRSFPAPRDSTTDARSSAIRTSMPGARPASGPFSRGTITRRAPAAARHSARARAPRTAAESTVQGQLTDQRERSAGGSPPEPRLAARIPIAMGRSRPAPLFRTPAGARLTVTRRAGKVRPIAEMAARTRAALSRTAASGRPTMSIRGSWELIRTSTSIGMPSTPERAAPRMRGHRDLRGTASRIRRDRRHGLKAGPAVQALPSTFEKPRQGWGIHPLGGVSGAKCVSDMVRCLKNCLPGKGAASP